MGNRLGREPAHVGGGDHQRMLRQGRRGHLICRPAHIEASAGELTPVEGLQQGVFVDQLPSCCIDEISVWLHQRQSLGVDQIFGLRGRGGQADDIVRLLQQIGQPQRLNRRVRGAHIGVVDAHLHAKRLCQAAKFATDLAITNDPQTGALELPAHARLHRQGFAVAQGGNRDVAAQVNHHAEHPFGHRGSKARAGTRHQHALGAGRRKVNGSDVNGTTHHRQQIRYGGKKSCIQGGLAVGNQHLATLGCANQFCCVPVVVARVELDLRQQAQLGQRLVAKITVQAPAGMSQQNQGLDHLFAHNAGLARA